MFLDHKDLNFVIHAHSSVLFSTSRSVYCFCLVSVLGERIGCCPVMKTDRNIIKGVLKLRL